MKRNLLIACLILPVICLLAWVIYLSTERQTGRDVTVVITGYDPRDLLGGRYIAYQIDWKKTDCTQFKGNICPKHRFCHEAKWGRRCRFYVPQDKAAFLDKVFRNTSKTGDIFEVVYTYHEHRLPLAKTLLINGKDWHEYQSQSNVSTEDKP
ncbi:MAG: GDYXXLXY domain-containing protein [Alphaproteobacteria bacterium]|nr:GDYXXLXY domain-containing protein [Alphaproteobacteria bacterium]